MQLHAAAIQLTGSCVGTQGAHLYIHTTLQDGEAARQMRTAPQPKYWGCPANRSGHLQVQAQEALAHESPMLVCGRPNRSLQVYELCYLTASGRVE